MKTKNKLSVTESKLERPHPLRTVPGTGRARWDALIGRWVVGMTTGESLAFATAQAQ